MTVTISKKNWVLPFFCRKKMGTSMTVPVSHGNQIYSTFTSTENKCKKILKEKQSGILYMYLTCSERCTRCVVLTSTRCCFCVFSPSCMLYSLLMNVH